MKKIISILCIVAMMLSYATICANAWEISDNEGYDDEFNPLSYIGYVGDVDSSYSVNITDVTYIQMYIAEALDLRSANKVLSDVDQSGVVNVMDATCIQLWLADLPVDAPVYHKLGDNEMGDHWCSFSITNVPNKCQEGYIEYECYECGDYYTSHYKDAVHNWEVDRVKEPDCSDGYTDYKCKDCGTYDTVFDEGTGTGHNWGEWQVVTEPDYGVDGEERLYCSKCKQYQSRTLDMLIEGNQDAIAAAREVLPIITGNIHYFDTLDEAFTQKYYGVGSFRLAFYRILIKENKYEINEDTGLYMFKRSDLDEVTIRYFDRTYDWKSCTSDRDFEAEDYYDEATDTMNVWVPFGYGGGNYYRISSCTDNGDGTYTFNVDTKELGPFDWEPHVAELVLKRTDNGYPAVSFICCHSWGEWSELKPSTIYLEGTEVRRCENCFDYEERVTEKLPSDYTEEELAKLSAVATTAEDMFDLFRVTVRFFDSVDEIFEYDEFNLKELAYLKADRESDDGYLIYKRSDLDDALLSYFGRTYDWTQLNDYGEDSVYSTEYYDADTDTVVRYSFGGYGIAERWMIKIINKTSDDTFEVEVEIQEGGSDEITNAVLTLVETEHGYNAVSLKVVD